MMGLAVFAAIVDGIAAGSVGCVARGGMAAAILPPAPLFDLASGSLLPSRKSGALVCEHAWLERVYARRVRGR